MTGSIGPLVKASSQRFITEMYSLGSMAIKRSRLEGLSASRST